jgi:predicted metal-dependent phosphoesterase TrpH
MLAAQAGVELLALSDHDSVDGVEEALVAGRDYGIGVVRATEISALDGDREDLHVLGYEVDHHAPVLLDALASFRHDREGRADRMIAALRELGWEVDETLLDARRVTGKTIGRPHIAAAAFNHPANAARLAEEGLENSSDLLVAYLIPGAPAFRLRTFPTVTEAIALIHEAGGVAVWAHPFWDLDHDADVLDAVDRFVSDGLDGVETFYITHTRAQIELLAAHCSERGLLTTGSADFHGPEHPHFHSFRAFELHGLEPNLGRIGA